MVCRCRKDRVVVNVEGVCRDLRSVTSSSQELKAATAEVREAMARTLQEFQENLAAAMEKDKPGSFQFVESACSYLAPRPLQMD